MLALLLASAALVTPAGPQLAPGPEPQGEVGRIPQTPVPGYDKPPKPLHITRPQYPQDAFNAGKEGTVLVEILIDSKGRVAGSRVLQSVPGLDEAALRCTKDWTFEPAVRSGKPVSIFAQAPISFWIYAKKDRKRDEGAEKEPWDKWRGALDLRKVVGIDSDGVARVDSIELAALRVEPGALTPPKLIERGHLSYPRPTLAASSDGAVGLECAIRDSGRVEACRVLRSVSRDLDGAAKSAIEHSTYEPARVSGKAQSIIASVSVTFRSNDQGRQP
jgi:TonB family protein